MVRMDGEHRAEYVSDWAAQTSCDMARRTLLDGEAKTLRRADEILRTASTHFAKDGVRPPRDMVMGFIKPYHMDVGIEPSRRELAIAPASLHEHAACLTAANQLSA
jgi:hypothetical protein